MMGHGLMVIQAIFYSHSISDVPTITEKVIYLFFNSRARKKRLFSGVKSLSSRKIGVRLNFLWPLGCHALEKNNKTYKYSA